MLLIMTRITPFLRVLMALMTTGHYYRACRLLCIDMPRAFIEIGSTQKDAVSALAIESGLAVCGIELDFSGRDRCLILTHE